MLIKIFCQIDDFCKEFKKNFNKNVLSSGKNLRVRSFGLELSEIISISIYYHYSGYKTFKDYYEKQVLIHMTKDFKNLVSYNRFLELRKKAIAPMVAFMQLSTMNKNMGISFIDSFALNVSHVRRVSSHKVFKGLAQKGKTSVGWFYGFKLHLVTNVSGDIISFYITSGNVADSNEAVILKLTKNLIGKLFGDRGYLLNKNLFKKLYLNGLHVITKLRKNMKQILMPYYDKIMLRKRGIIESIGGILKESMSLEHSRHRSISGFFVHIMSTLCAYDFRLNKPSIAKKLALA